MAKDVTLRVRISEEGANRIDELRGAETRSAYIRRVLGKATAQSGVVTAPIRGPREEL